MIRKRTAPPMISHGGQPVTRLFFEPGASWYVARVKSNQELTLAENLSAARVSYYLPYTPVRTRSGRTVRDGVRVALPGFLFFLGNFDERELVAKRRETAGVLNAKDQVLLVSDLVKFHTALATASAVRLVSLSKLRIGDAVRGREGTKLDGVTGTVMRKGGTTLILRVGLLGAAEMTISPESLTDLEFTHAVR